MIARLSLLLAACSGASAPRLDPPAITNTAPAPRTPRPSVPTLATAGAATCTPGEVIVLGTFGGTVALGFDDRSGVAAWKREPTVLSIQPIALDGSKLGEARSAPVAEGLEPRMMYALGGRFVVILRRWDWQKQDLAWFAVVVEHGRAGPAIDLGLANFDLWVGQVLDAQRIGLLVGPRADSQVLGASSRWQTLELDASGRLTSRAIAVDLGGLAGDWQEAELAGARGWIPVRDGVRQPDGVFDGRRKSAASAVPMAPRDALTFAVKNTATPPPHGPGGTIIEAMGRPVFVRTAGEQPIGEPLRLEFHGNPIAHGMTIEDAIAWSGTHFIYPFWGDDGGPTHDKYVSRLLPIDCRP